MKTRFGRYFVGGLVTINLLAGVTAFLMRDNLFRELIKPAVPFQVDEQPAAPDYTDAAAWAMRPQAAASAEHDAEIFFVHPTTAWSGSSGWNMDIADAESRTRLESQALPNHAGPFADVGRLWVPRYRQAVLFSFLSQREDSREALNFAYQDVERAFEVFQNSRDKDAAFIMVGVGQGALHVLRLLQSRQIDTTNLAAVYLLDQPVPQSFLSPQPENGTKLPRPCQSKQEAGCLITYLTLDSTDPKEASKLKSRTTVWQPKVGYSSLNGQGLLCVNPLTGSEKAKEALASSNPGSAAASGLERGMKPAFLPSETGATCLKNGLLQVEFSRPAALTRPRFQLGTFYKTPEFNLFYAALTEDAQTRMNTMKPTTQ